MLEKHVIVPTPFVELWTNRRELHQYGNLLTLITSGAALWTITGIVCTAAIKALYLAR
jgi:hypothetical protein